jgi:hypothetical protein
MSPDHLAAITDARKRFLPIRRQIAVATFDAWTVAAFAGITAAFGVTSPPALCVGLAMGVIAFVEFRAIRQLRELDPAASRTLALNQFAFAAVLILYAAYNLISPGQGVSAEVREVVAADPQLGEMLAGFTSLVNRILYLGVIAFAVLFQGGCGIYHLTRVPLVRRYRDSTPPWVLQLHAAGLMR